jgi:hypothetical protein
MGEVYISPVKDYNLAGLHARAQFVDPQVTGFTFLVQSMS